MTYIADQLVNSATSDMSLITTTRNTINNNSTSSHNSLVPGDSSGLSWLEKLRVVLISLGAFFGFCITFTFCISLVMCLRAVIHRRHTRRQRKLANQPAVLTSVAAVKLAWAKEPSPSNTSGTPSDPLMPEDDESPLHSLHDHHLPHNYHNNAAGTSRYPAFSVSRSDGGRDGGNNPVHGISSKYQRYPKPGLEGQPPPLIQNQLMTDLKKIQKERLLVDPHIDF